MSTLWNEGHRAELVSRLGRLRGDAAARWGRMDAPHMLAHLADSLRMASGEVAPAARRLPLRHPPLKQLIVYVLPFAKNLPTAPELLAREPQGWAAERAALLELIERFPTLASQPSWPAHPAFGRLSPRAWGVLTARHVDHHLRQFGV